MALVFLPQYGGDQGESYQTGTDTAIRRFIVGRDDGSGAIDTAGAPFTPQSFYAQGGDDLARDQAQLVSGTFFDRVKVTQYSPYSVIAEVYQSNNAFYDLSTPENFPATPNSVFNVTTRDVQFTIPFIVVVEKAYPGSATPVMQRVEQELTDTTPITTIDVEVEVPTWRLPVEQDFVNNQAGAIHVINAIPYRFKGANSVRQISAGDVDTQTPPRYRVRYQWEFDVGSRVRDINTEDGVSTSLPKVFSNPSFSGRIFTGDWYRPPYTQVAIGTSPVELVIPLVNTVTIQVPDSGWFVEGQLGKENGWAQLPGNPVQ